MFVITLHMSKWLTGLLLQLLNQPQYHVMLHVFIF